MPVAVLQSPRAVHAIPKQYDVTPRVRPVVMVVVRIDTIILFKKIIVVSSWSEQQTEKIISRRYDKQQLQKQQL
jgi:hypothetical protein